MEEFEGEIKIVREVAEKMRDCLKPYSDSIQMSALINLISFIGMNTIYDEDLLIEYIKQAINKYKKVYEEIKNSRQKESK